MAKRITKAAAEAECRANLRKRLQREPTAAELATAVRSYIRAFNATGKAADAKLKRAKN